MRRNTICPSYVLWQWCLWKLPHQQTFDTFDTFIIATQHSVSGNCFSTALQLSSSGKGVYRHQRKQAPETITTHTKRKHVNVRLCTGNRDVYSWVSHHIKWPNRQKVQRLMMSREIGCVNPLAIYKLRSWYILFSPYKMFWPSKKKCSSAFKCFTHKRWLIYKLKQSEFSSQEKEKNGAPHFHLRRGE